MEGQKLDEVVSQSNEILDLFRDLQVFNTCEDVINFKPSSYPVEELELGDMCFYKIDKLMYDEDYPRREAFENIIAAFNNPSFNIVYILEGGENSVEMYIGVVGNEKKKTDNMSASREGDLLKRLFEGNFSGSTLTKLMSGTNGNMDLKNKIIQSTQQYKSVGSIMGIPSIDGERSVNELDFQGIDRLINSMLGLKWRMVVVCEPVSKINILELRDNIYEIYNRVAACSKYTMQISQNEGETFSNNINQSDSVGSSNGFGFNKSEGKTKSNSLGTKSTSEQTSNEKHVDYNRNHQKGSTVGYNQNRGNSKAVTFEIASKRMVEMMKYIDESLLERINIGYSKGLFKVSTYYMATNPDDANRLKVSIMSLFQGSESTFSPLVAKSFDGLERKDIDKVLRTYQNHFEKSSNINSTDIPLLNCRPYYENGIIGLGTYLTTKEISLIAGLPQKEVPGISLNKSVDFGLNLKDNFVDGKEAFSIGSIMHKGRILKDSIFSLSQKSLTKHIFIAGVTGSGKTTTCHKLLGQVGIPFMVIEPAKTEYRALINNKKYSDLLVLTLGDESIAPFRLNPFELLKGENISSHIDMIKATFISSFHMEASMPQILEEAIYKCYEKKGWDIDSNENFIYGDKAYDDSVDSFPILSDLLIILEEIVESKKFGAELKSNYIGSLVSRLSNLTVGVKGSMLNCTHSMNFKYLVNSNVIIEMEELKSPEDKSLFMGFILSKTSAIIKAEYKKKKIKGKTFQHITLVEEAHRLLAKPELTDGGSKKMAVEIFTDLLAEIRKYGESLIIVDQIPNKLASEVLKNTNTKIIHKILAQDDKEAVGDTMLMDEEQKQHLSSLGPGEAIVFNENTDKPVHIMVHSISDTTEDIVSDDVVKVKFMELKEHLGNIYSDIKLEKYYKMFVKAFDKLNISGCGNEQNDIDSLILFLEGVATSCKTTPEKAWAYFIKRRDIYSGKSIQNMDTEIERIQKIVSFYQKVLIKKEVTKEILRPYHNLF